MVLIDIQVIHLITHEPQAERLGSLIVDFCFQEVLGSSKDLIHCRHTVRQSEGPGFHLKVDILQLQCDCFTLQGN